MMRLGLLCLLLSLSAAVSAKTWYVGILAPQGAEAARAQWQPWLNWLGEKQPEEQFVLVPLALADWQHELAAGLVDSALGPQAQFVMLPDTEGWRWLATARFPNGHTPRATEQVGSAIWVRQEALWRNERDLHGKRIAAVDEQAFGGFMLAEHLLLQHGLHAGKDYLPVFTGYPIEQTVKRCTGARWTPPLPLYV